MSDVKDLLIIFLFIFFVIKYVLLTKEMVKQREYFINVLNHDLRVSTLAQIRGLELLTKKNLTNNYAINLISEINESCKFTFDMITMLLKTYKFENGEQVEDFETIDLTNLLDNVCSNLNYLTSEKFVQINKKISNSCRIEANQEDLSKALSNILLTIVSNAHRNSYVNLFVKNKMNKVEIIINYQGIPLSEEEYNRMYSNKTHFSTVGNGIRMNLCKKIIDFHNGNVLFYSNKKGENTFKVIIPQKQLGCVLKIPSISVLQPYKQ